MERVPFFDLRDQTRILRPELDAAFDEVLGHATFILGPEGDTFERRFAAFCGAKHCVGVGSGTAALRLSLVALGIGSGDEVILPANTYIASALAISQTGARPVFVDVDEFHHMNCSAVRAAITEHTRAIMPVHLYGQAMPMLELLEVARAKGLHVIEDACQAHGARLGERHVGTLGTAGCFSFYPSKNLGAFGDGGAVVTDDDTLADGLRLLRDFGQRRKYEHVLKGDNSRLDSIQAAVLLTKLKYLNAWNDRRRAIAAVYDRELGALGLEPPLRRERSAHVYHLYVVEVENRDEARSYLHESGVDTGIHYPIPIHRQGAFAELNIPKGSYPNTERACDHALSLPMFPELTDPQVERVISVLRAYLRA